jgi:hypothetical protein
MRTVNAEAGGDVPEAIDIARRARGLERYPS